MTYEDFLAKYDSIRRAVIEEISKTIKDRKRRLKRPLSIEEIDEIVDSFDVVSIMRKNGFGEFVYQFLLEFDNLVVDRKGKINTESIRRVADLTDMVKTGLGEYLLGQADSYNDLLKLNVIQNLAGNISTDQMIINLETTGLSRAQLGSVITTAFHNHSRNVTKLSFEEDGNDKFKYVGDIVKRSSKVCTWLVKNQRKEGYTMKEIMSGIDTPHGIINWYGRIPNHNCIHEWMPIA